MPAAWGHALVTRVDNGSSNDGTVLDAWFHELGWGESAPTSDRTTADQHHALRAVLVSVATIVIDTDSAPTNAIDVYLRLHLLSHRLAKPRTLNLDGAFGLLTNVAWTNIGPILPENINQVRWEERRSGHLLNVHGVDKFPRMTDYVVPSGVRIADANRVRLGAHLATGTTVMHEGFCNSMPARLARQWLKAAFPPAWLSVTEATSVVVPQSWAHFQVAEKKLSALASVVCWAQMPASESALVTSASLKLAYMSRVAHSSRCPMVKL